MAYKIRQAKLELLISAYQHGEVIDKDSTPEILGITTPAAIKQYLKSFNEWVANGEGEDEERVVTDEVEAPPVAKTTFIKSPKRVDELRYPSKEIKDYTFIIENENGAEEEFEPITVTSSTVVLRKIEPIIKTITIGGSAVEVDLRKLRKLDPMSMEYGVMVSTLILAAELA